MQREVFWAIDHNKNKTLIAWEWGKYDEHQLHYFYEAEYPDFVKTKDFLFQTWRNDPAAQLPILYQTRTWKVTSTKEYPAELAQPEKEEKKEQLLRNATRTILSHNSAIFRREIQVGLDKFKEKIAGLTTFHSQDLDFLELLEKQIRAAQEQWNTAEQNPLEETECLNGNDARELRNEIREAKTQLDKLRNQQYNETYKEIEAQILEAETRFAQDENWREQRETLFEIRATLRETQLNRNQKDALFSRLETLTNAIQAKQQAEKEAQEAIFQVNFEQIQAQLVGFPEKIAAATYFNEVRNELKIIQQSLQETPLNRTQRTQLFEKIDGYFKDLYARQSAERGKTNSSQTEDNLQILKERLEIGRKLATYHEEFQEVRDYLKEIQTELFDLKLTKEQRTELKEELNALFELVKQRADKYFEHKRRLYEQQKKVAEDLKRKKRELWEMKLKESILYLDRKIKQTHVSIQKDEAFLETLQERFEDTGKESFAEKMQKVRQQIQEYQSQIAKWTEELAEKEQVLKQG